MAGRGWGWAVVGCAVGAALLGCGRRATEADPIDARGSAVGALPVTDEPGATAEATVLAEAPDQQVLTDLFVDANGVTFGGGRTDQGESPSERDAQVGVVRQVGKDGGVVRELWRGAGVVVAVVGAADGVYFLAHDYPGRAGRLWRVGKWGGLAKELGGWRAHGTCPGLAADREHVYWSHSGGGLGGPILRTPVGGGPTVTIGQGQTCPGGMALAAGAVVWAGDRSVLSVPRPEGGEARALATFVIEVDAVAAAPSGEAVYAVADRRLVKVGMGGGEPTLLATLTSEVSALAADDRHVYLALSGSGEIVRVPVGGGRPVVLAEAGVPAAIAVDEAFVYWVDRAGRRVMRVAKGR